MLTESATNTTATKPAHFICGPDDFLVNRQGQEFFDKVTASLADPLSMEIIEGAAQNVAEVEKAIANFSQGVQTLSLFGEKKVVWFKGITFISDSVTGRAESTKAQVEFLVEMLSKVDPAFVTVVLTASPIDRRTRGYKALEKLCQSTFIASDTDSESLQSLAQSEVDRLGIRADGHALRSLVERIGGNTRLLTIELEKLATYLGGQGELTASLVLELVPQFGEGDFFEVCEAFFSLDLQWTLDAIRRHFFTQKESRPLLAAFQNRNRLLIQLRVLLDANAIQVTHRGIDKASLQAASQRFDFEEFKDKSSYNVFTQHPFYLGKLVQTAKKVPLKRLIRFQQAFLLAFESILEHSDAQESSIRSLALSQLA